MGTVLSGQVHSLGPKPFLQICLEFLGALLLFPFLSLLALAACMAGALAGGSPGRFGWLAVTVETSAFEFPPASPLICAKRAGSRLQPFLSPVATV